MDIKYKAVLKIQDIYGNIQQGSKTYLASSDTLAREIAVQAFADKIGLDTTYALEVNPVLVEAAKVAEILNNIQADISALNVIFSNKTKQEFYELVCTYGGTKYRNQGTKFSFEFVLLNYRFRVDYIEQSGKTLVNQEEIGYWDRLGNYYIIKDFMSTVYYGIL